MLKCRGEYLNRVKIEYFTEPIGELRGVKVERRVDSQVARMDDRRIMSIDLALFPTKPTAS